MAITSMSLINKLALAMLISGVAMASAHAVTLTCPATNHGAALKTVTLFDGPPSEHADLAPDSSDERKGTVKSHWDVGYIFQAGRALNVQCEYGAAAKDIILTAPKTIKACTYVSRRGGKPSLTCSDH